MNVNNSGFHLFLGEADWGRCRVDSAAGPLHLADVWAASTGSPPLAPRLGNEAAGADAPVLAWDTRRKELRLQELRIELGATPGEVSFGIDARRSAAADCYGNIYWIDSDPTQLRVRSNGSRNESPFWPAGLDEPGDRHASLDADFTALPVPTTEPPVFRALTVTEDHYLVVAFTSPEGAGLLAFDLMAGGPPQKTRWSASADLVAWDMAPRCGGGAWVLERDGARLWELDCRLALVTAGQPVAPSPPADADLFQPTTGPARARPPATPVPGIDLAAVAGQSIDPIAIEMLACGDVLLLDRNQGAGRSRVFRLRRDGDSVHMDAPVLLDQLAQDFVLAKGGVRDTTDAPRQLFVATAMGNQALAYTVSTADSGLGLASAKQLFPLRRFGGRALVSVLGTAWYDSGISKVLWTPVVQQPRMSYRESGELVTPVLDGAELQCNWDRLMIDACIPADARVEVWCRASDECDALGTDNAEVIGSWAAQPALHLRADGAELPWLRAQAVRRTRRKSGTGTWELLLQNLRGRYLQIKLRLSGNGTASPWLRAMRVWMPRFSYSQRFLPAVFRESAVAASFVERFLANMEGMNTVIEDRIAQVQALFDPACAPAEALDWLASWFDVAFEPTWDERRRRLFIAHAMDFFRWRGTTHGLRLALSLAFDPCIDALAFADPDPDCTCVQSIRIVEAYLTRRVGALAAGDPGAAIDGPRTVSQAAPWSPAEGNSGLVQRYVMACANSASVVDPLRQFALVAPPADPNRTDAQNADMQACWNSFVEASFGFVPSAGPTDRQRWQNFLVVRFVSVSEVPTPLRGDADSFSAIDLPADEPGTDDAATVWKAYCALLGDNRVRERWQDFLARRYRRIERLNGAWRTSWKAFDRVALPDRLPVTTDATGDWLQFERQLMAMLRTAHRFSVLLPVTSVTEDPFEMERHLQLARRIVELEKPAHTVFDVRFYWALNRVGEARLGLDTLLDDGSRSPKLRPDAVLGRSYVGASFVGGPTSTAGSDRRLLAC